MGWRFEKNDQKGMDCNCNRCAFFRSAGHNPLHCSIANDKVSPFFSSGNSRATIAAYFRNYNCRPSFKRKNDQQFFVWAAVAIASIYFVTFKNLQVDLQTGSQTIIAAVLAVSSGIMWGTSTAISKFVLNKVNVLTATAERFSLGALFAFIINHPAKSNKFT